MNFYIEKKTCVLSLNEALIWETELAVVLFVLSLTPCLEKGLTRWIRFCGKTRATITGKFSDVISSTDPCGAAAMPLHTLSSTHPSSFIRDVWQIPLKAHWAKYNCETCLIENSYEILNEHNSIFNWNNPTKCIKICIDFGKKLKWFCPMCVEKNLHVKG